MGGGGGGCCRSMDDGDVRARRGQTIVQRLGELSFDGSLMDVSTLMVACGQRLCFPASRDM